MAAPVEELECINEIGPTIAASVVRFFANPENQRVIEKLKRAGYKFIYPDRRVGLAETISWYISNGVL